MRFDARHSRGSILVFALSCVIGLAVVRSALGQYANDGWPAIENQRFEFNSPLGQPTLAPFPSAEPRAEPAWNSGPEYTLPAPPPTNAGRGTSLPNWLPPPASGPPIAAPTTTSNPVGSSVLAPSAPGGNAPAAPGTSSTSPAENTPGKTETSSSNTSTTVIEDSDALNWIPENSWLPNSWYEWFIPEFWNGGLEVGINSTEGNAEALSLRAGGNVKRKTEMWEFKTDLTYTKATANGLESQHDALFNAGYERQLGQSQWSHFGKTFVEYDEFKAFDLRLALNAGLGRILLKDDATTVKARFGAGTSHEINSPDSRWLPEAVFGGDLSHQVSDRQKMSLTTDYFPEWTDFSNFRLVTDASWVVTLDSASNLSLKLSMNDRYDSTPNGRRPNDVTYALLLLWQL